MHIEKLDELVSEAVLNYCEENGLRAFLDSDYSEGLIKVKLYE